VRKKAIYRFIWVNLILVSFLTFSYNYFDGWWYSSIGTGGILLFSYLAWKADFRDVTGLRIPIRVIIISIILSGIVIACSVLLVWHIGKDQGFSLGFTDWRSYFHDVFYTLNEEIILGAIPIYFLVRKLKINTILVSAGMALIFAVMHFVFYKWIFLQKGILELSTLTTLFMVGVLRNNLIILFRQIGYSWALHFGWMAVMFGSFIQWTGTDEGLTEPERFNVLLGSSEMMMVSIILAAASSILLVRKSTRQPN
jgi:hypothetical protein